MKMKRIWAVTSELNGLAREPGRVLPPAAGQSLRSYTLHGIPCAGHSHGRGV